MTPDYQYPRPALTTDVVLFAGDPPHLSILLIRRGTPPFQGKWALPGGFVDEGEPIEDAARRELAEETGVEWDGLLVQVGAFGDPGRDPRGWTVAVAWTARTSAQIPARGGDDAAEAAWWSVHGLPSLAFDHDLIIAAAVRAMSPEIHEA